MTPPTAHAFSACVAPRRNPFRAARRHPSDRRRPGAPRVASPFPPATLSPSFNPPTRVRDSGVPAVAHSPVNKIPEYGSRLTWLFNVESLLHASRAAERARLFSGQRFCFRHSTCQNLREPGGAERLAGAPADGAPWLRRLGPRGSRPSRTAREMSCSKRRQ